MAKKQIDENFVVDKAYIYGLSFSFYKFYCNVLVEDWYFSKKNLKSVRKKVEGISNWLKNENCFSSDSKKDLEKLVHDVSLSLKGINAGLKYRKETYAYTRNLQKASKDVTPNLIQLLTKTNYVISKYEIYPADL
jgi:hypothetical protein